MAEQIEIRVNIPTEELEKKCRTCLKNDGVLNLFLTRHKDIMLYHLFPILSLPQMDPSDVGLPQKICGICAKAIFEFYAFKERTAQTQVILELAAGKLRYLNIEKSEKEEKPNDSVEDVVIEASPESYDIKQEIIIDDDKIKREKDSIKEKTTTNKHVVAKCRFCKQKFTKYSDYLNHRTEEREKRVKVQCPICRDNIMSYRMENHLIVHRIKGHYAVPQNEIKSEVKPKIIINQQTKNNYSESNAIIDHDYIDDILKSNYYNCALCKRKFKSRAEYISHRRKEKEKRQKTPCPVCNKKIPLFRMERHSLTHKCKNAELLIDERSGEMTCGKCNEAFSDENDFNLHLNDNEPELNPAKINKNACPICKKKFTPARLKDHMSVHDTNMKRYMCEVCGKQFSYQTSLRFHKHSEITGESLCDSCGKGFSSPYHLKLHKRRIHAETRSFACDFCGKSFKNAHHRSIHMRQHTGERPYECKICGKKFTQKPHLQTHLKSLHNPTVNVFQCGTCYRRYNNAEQLAEHEKRHGDAKKTPIYKKKKDKCDVCNNLVLDLRGHKKLHDAGYTYVCGFCNEGFTERYDLTTHKISVHFSKRRIFTCDICNKSVTTSQMLESHRRIHTGEKPFQCKLCEKSFTQGSHLNTHMKWHTGEKEFECEYCKKRFALKGNLKQHLRSHTGDKPFACAMCLKSFPTASSLRKHVGIHSRKGKFMEEYSMSS